MRANLCVVLPLFENIKSWDQLLASPADGRGSRKEDTSQWWYLDYTPLGTRHCCPEYGGYLCLGFLLVRVAAKAPPNLQPGSDPQRLLLNTKGREDLCFHPKGCSRFPNTVHSFCKATSWRSSCPTFPLAIFFLEAQGLGDNNHLSGSSTEVSHACFCLVCDNYTCRGNVI